MPRSPQPEVRELLLDRAASMVARREPVTLRSLVAGTGVSTMAVYTYFGGMSELWGALRQEGFSRLATRIAAVGPGRDPVEHLAALGVAYVENAVANPDLYRVMFDATFDLPDPVAANASFEHLVAAASRSLEAGRVDARVDPADLALRVWATGHGIVSLAVTGVLPVDELRRHAPAMVVALLVDAGDSPERARRSVNSAWKAVDL